MKIVTAICLSVLVSSCRNESKVTIIENFKYTTYWWNLNLNDDSPHIYVHSYIDIDRNGNFLIMKHKYDSSARSNQWVEGKIDDRTRIIIDSILGNKVFKKTYLISPVDNILYCGSTYCFDYKKTNGERNTIKFYPIKSPKEIQTLTSLLDSVITHENKNMIDSFSIREYEKELIRIDGPHIFPKLEKPNVIIRTIND